LIDQEKIYDQCLSEDPEERIEALEQLEACFSLILDRKQAWIYLHRLTNDEDIGVRCRAASAIDCVFSEISDKQEAWEDLIKLANDEDLYVRKEVVSVLGSLLSHVPDKEKTLNDLIKRLFIIFWSSYFRISPCKTIKF
jgi:HEAT repeat protein